MQMSDKKENGVKLSWQHLSGISGIPLKKRPLSFLRSQSPPSPSSQITHATKLNEVKIEPPNSPTKDYKTPSDLSHQKSLTRNVDATTVSLFKGKDEPIGDNETSLKCSRVSDSRNQGYVTTVDSSFALELTTCTKPVLDDSIASGTTGNIESNPKITEKPEYSFLETTIEKIPSDKSAFHRVFGKTEASSLKESISLNTESDYNDLLMQEKVDSSYGDTPFDVQCNTAEPALTSNLAQNFAKRSHWDLNTMMDTWGGLLTSKGKNHSEGGNHTAMGVSDIITKVNHETCSSGMIDGKVKTANLLQKYSKNDKLLKLSHSAMLPTGHLSSDAHIDLHLSPVSETPSKFTPIIVHVPKTNTNGCLSDLSLTMKPSSTILKPVKSESHVINDSNVDISNSKLISHTIVKSEPSTSVHRLVSSKISSASSLSVKSESQEMDYRMRMETMEESLQHKEKPASYMDNYIPGTDMQENIRQIDDGMISKSTVTNSNISCNLQLKMHNTDILNGIKEPKVTVWTASTDKDKEKNNHQATRTALYNENIDKSSKTTVTMGTSKANITTALNSESMVHCSKNSISSTHLLVASETNGIGHGSLDVKSDMHFESPKQKQENNDEYYNTCDAEGGMNMATSETDAIGSMDRLTNVSSKSPKLRSQNNAKLSYSCDADSRTHTNHVGIHHDDDMEDGEVRDPQHYSSNDPPSDEKHEIDLKHIRVKEDTKNKEGDHFLKCNSNQSIEEIELHPTEDVNKSFLPTIETTNESPTNMITDSPSHHMSETISRIASSENIITPFEEQQGEVIVENKKSSDSKLLPKILSAASNSETLVNTGDTENGFRRGDDSYLNSFPRNVSPERSVYGSRTTISRRNGFRRGSDPYMKSFPRSFSPGRPYGYRSTLSSHNDKNSSSWSQRNDKYRGIRGGKGGNYRDLRVYEKDRIRDGSSKKPGYDISFSPERVRFRNLNDNRFSGPDFLSEQFSGSGNLRYTRPRNPPETSFAAFVGESTDSAGGEAGTSGNDKLEIFSPRPSRRWSPRRREGSMLVNKQFINRTMRGISPGRFIDSEIPVLFKASNEGKFMRRSANNMDDPSILTGHSNYSRGGNSSYIRRSRREISPDQERESPNISMRPRLRSPHLWSPQRLPDEFDVHPELIPCRSPQSLRFQRVGSPIEDGSFAENMAGRRHGSPPFVSRGRDGMRMREYDYPRHGRSIQRNVRRFQLIDPRVNVEEECFGEVAQASQLNGMPREARMERNFNSGHSGFVRYINRRYNDDAGISDDNSRNFSYRIERGPSRPMRFRPDTGEEQPHRQQTLRGDHCVRNRMEDSPRRIRGLDGQEGSSYDVDETQGGSSSALKRRRF